MNDEPHEASRPDHEGGKDHDQKVFHIFVNTRPRIHKEPSITFQDVVDLAKLPLPANHQYYVTFHDGPSANAEGELQSGQTISIKNEMAFDVSTTYQS